MSTEARREMQETERERVEGKRCRVAVCAAAGCLSNGGQAVRDALQKTVKEAGAAGEVEVFGTGCLGLCDAGPLVQVQAEGETRLYEKVDPSTAARIAAEDAVAGTPAKDLLQGGNDAFFAKQRKIVLENSGRIDPERIESCVAEGAYEALQKAVTEMTPLDVIQQITASGLRGRGGGGYPTGLKWGTVAKAKGTRKYVICNARRGRPRAPSWTAACWRATRTGARRHGDRRLRGRRRPGLHLRPRRVPAGDPAAARRRSSRRRRPSFLGSRIFDTASTSASTSASAPGPSSAARRPP